MRKHYSINEILSSLAGAKEICKNCLYFKPELGHGRQPMWIGPCLNSVWRKRVKETETCSKFIFDTENKRNHPDYSREELS